MLAALLLLAADFRTIAPAAFDLKDPLSGIPVRVIVDGFAIARTETTQREYEAVMRRNPSAHRGPELPVENLSWHDAIAFANALSVRERLRPCYASGQRIPGCNGYRLPTETEWQLAAGNAKPAGALGVASVKETAALRDRPTQPADENMHGNVWEWCEDWFAVERSPWPVRNPRGPLRGLERVLRGGSTVSTTGSWARQYRSGMDPAKRSSRTGIRLARSTGDLYQEPAVPLPTAERQPAPAHWLDALGRTTLTPLPPQTRTIRKIEHNYFNAELKELRTEPDAWEKILILDGDPTNTKPRPVLIVPYYDVDTPAAVDLGGRNVQPLGVRSFAWLAAQQGWIAVAVRWFGESYGERYDEAVANLHARHPNWSGLGKWVWDSQRLLDWIATQPGMDSGRVAMMGHSLGGKMTLYAMAFDPRIRLGVASELGISLKFSNYEDYWYLGERIRQLPPQADHHELLQMIAPRPFHLIAGEDSDGEKSRALLDRVARPGWTVSFTNHKAGHTPTPASVGEAFAWLRRYIAP